MPINLTTLFVPWKGWVSISANLHFVLTVMATLLLIVDVKLCSIAIALLFINWLSGQGYKHLVQRYKEAKEGFLLPLFFLLHVIGLLYSSNLHYGFSDIERKLSLLVLPLVLLARPLSISQRDFLIVFFTFFAIVLSTIGLARGLYHYDVIANERGPEHLVTNFADIHRVYFSMYLLFCYLALFYIHRAYLLGSSKFGWLTWFGAALLILFLFIMASRMMLILLILSSVMMLVYFMVVKNKQYVKALGFCLVGLAVLVLVYTQVSHVRTFMGQLTQKLDAGQTEDVNSVNIRVVKYKCAIQGIEANWFWGVGTGDIQDTLNALYLKNGFHKGYEVNMDAHNQYLQTWLAQGLVGLVLLLAFLFFNLKKGIKERNYLLLFVLCIFTICNLSESLLTTQKGVVFLALFFPLTFYSNKALTEMGLKP
jgi:O-antigen ligase